MQELAAFVGFSGAKAVSADGSVVVGTAEIASGLFGHAFRWTAAGGVQDLGTLPGYLASFSSAVSADGSTVVGSLGNLGPGQRAFRWTAAGGMQDLGVLPGYLSTTPVAVSADGGVVVGSTTLANGSWHAFLWTAAGGVQDLGKLGGITSSAGAVSADGGIVAGNVRFADGRVHAFRWTAAGGMQDLGCLPNGIQSLAFGISGDGRVVAAGTLQAIGGGVARVFRWTLTGGLQFPGVGVHGVTEDYTWAVSPDGSVVVGDSDSRAFRIQSSILGETYCRPTVENSTGCGGVVLANGDPRLATGALELTATLLPQNSFGFFLTSQAQGNVVSAGGSDGTLCLGGSIGRFVGPGQVMNSGVSGSFTMTVDLNAVPAATPTGVTAVQPGETWNFQCWHRDVNPTATSNFTDAVSITFH